jgi:hypothetical protein
MLVSLKAISLPSLALFINSCVTVCKVAALLVE